MATPFSKVGSTPSAHHPVAVSLNECVDDGGTNRREYESEPPLQDSVVLPGIAPLFSGGLSAAVADCRTAFPDGLQRQGDVFEVCGIGQYRHS